MKSSQPVLFPELAPTRPTLRDVADLVRLSGLEGLSEAVRRADDARYQEITVKSAPVWVGVTNAAGQQLYWDVLAAGQTKEFTDSSRLDVTLGDAAGVALQLNGKALPLAGTDGQVVTASFGPTGQL